MKYVDILIKARFEEGGLQLTKAQFLLLRFLQSGPQPQSSLALITERDKGSLTRLVQSMERKKLVKRKVDKEDQRINLVEMTNLGEQVLVSAVPILQGLVDSLTNGISAEEQEQTQFILNKIKFNAIAALNEYKN